MVSFSFYFDLVSKVGKMKAWLGLLVFFVAVSEISATKLNVTIFYETLCPYCLRIFKNQIWPAYQDPNIRNNIYIEMVPFGHANYRENPFSITCQHGPPECLGNVLQACFMERHKDNYKQVAFVSCCMSENYPPNAGAKCAKKLGYSYEGVEKCARSNEGNQLQIKHGKRTKGFKPKVAVVPTVVYDNVYNDRDQEESTKNFKAVVLRKLKAKGIVFDE